ncbi:hypothetical protein D7M10_25455 [Pseudomonas fluorescens]|nr:hypothetical protein D7M10_25455 [Pseudomonas fluorescens]
MWRGGLPPLGCEAALKSATRFFQKNCSDLTGTAARSNGGKPPRHNSPSAQAWTLRPYSAEASCSHNHQ